MKFHIENLSAPISLKICKEDIQKGFVKFADFRRDVSSIFRQPPTLIKSLNFERFTKSLLKLFSKDDRYSNIKFFIHL